MQERDSYSYVAVEMCRRNPPPLEVVDISAWKGRRGGRRELERLPPNERPLSRKGQAGVRGVEQLPQPHVEGVHRRPVGRLHRSGLARHGPRRAHRRDGDGCAARTREPRSPPRRRGGGDAECGSRRRERSAEQSGREREDPRLAEEEAVRDAARCGEVRREDPRLADADREGSDAVPRVAGHVWHVFDEGDDGACAPRRVGGECLRVPFCVRVLCVYPSVPTSVWV